MKSIRTIIFLLLFYHVCLSQDYSSTFYISPGIRISWDLKSNIFLDFKVSLGRMVSEEHYYNITFGKKIILNKKASAIFNNHNYIDFQVGSFGNYYPISTGTGLGVAIFTKSNVRKLYPRFTLFAGVGLFCTLDYVFKRNLIDLGLQGVLPIPFNEDYRTFNQ
jgi:hypothetical protein